MTPPGGVADEASKLLLALEGWLRGAVGNDEAGLRSAEQHGPGSPCEICPFCQLITAARTVRPDVVEHLSQALGSVVLAFRALTDAAAAPSDSDREPPTQQSAVVVQHITVN